MSVTEHFLHLEAFEHLPSTVGAAIDGSRFEAGGHEWFLRVCPGGDDADGKEHVSVYLHYAGSCDGVSASFTLETTHSTCPGAVVSSATQSGKVRTYARSNDEAKGWIRSWGYKKLIEGVGGRWDRPR
jgi:hypothetical protein